MKVCNTCKTAKPLSDYSKDRRMLDGHRNDCKICLKEYRNVPERKQKERDWQRRSMDKYAKTRRRYRESNRVNDRLYEKKYSALNRKKINCHAKVHIALKKGRMSKPKTCSECPCKTKIQGHHEDYNKPLDVIWLCPKCHKKRHLKVMGN